MARQSGSSLEDLEKDGVVSGRDPEGAEFASLRQELWLRILLQNGLLVASVGLYGGIGVLSALRPGASWQLAMVQNTAILAAALQWCHHGVRTAQIKQFLLLGHSRPDGWEDWLPRQRPPGFFGSRWMVSTKGVFLGLGLASMVQAALSAPEPVPLVILISGGLWTIAAGFLVTNPKE